MFKLDNAFLEELGLGTLPPVEKNKMLAHIYETLEMRVGMKLAEKMTNEQLDEFESYIQKKDEAGALKWLESNFPDYKQVVAQELEKLKGEISQVAPQITAQFANAQPAIQQPINQPVPQQQVQVQQDLYASTVAHQPAMNMPQQQQSFAQPQELTQNAADFSQPQPQSYTTPAAEHNGHQSAAPAVPQQNPLTESQPNVQQPISQPDPVQLGQSSASVNQLPINKIPQQTTSSSSDNFYDNRPVTPQKPWHPDDSN